MTNLALVTLFITKNPLHPHWRTEVWTQEKYELDYLAEFVELCALTKTEKENWLGRNCTLFDTVTSAVKSVQLNLGDFSHTA